MKVKAASMVLGAVAGAALTAVAIGAGARPGAGDGAEAQAAFEAIKALEGTWMMTEEGVETGDIGSIYHVTAGGSAVVETMFPGAEHEMVTVYYVEDGALKMTHYCMMGNRPVLTANHPTPHEMSFVCSAEECCGEEAHMHAAVITIVDETHVRSTWSGNDAADEAVEFTLVRRVEGAGR